MRENWAVRLIRACFRHWPLARGKGLLLRLFAPLLKKGMLVEIEPGVVFRADLSDYVHYWCFSGEHYKDPGFQLSLSLIRPGDTVIDVGANIGLWSLAAARRVGASGELHAFEPVPSNFSQLIDNLALNGFDRVRCRQSALADRCGSSFIYETTNGNCGAARLASGDGIDHPLEIDLVTLDHYREEHGLRRVDFMKVDVEGAEILVFLGGRQLLSGPEAPAIMFEFSRQLMGDFCDVPTLLSLLTGYGYHLHLPVDGILIKVDINEIYSFTDIFALKQLHLERFEAVACQRREHQRASP